jgi:hypothetical protein
MDALTWVMHNHGLKSLKQRLRAVGFLNRNEMANALGRSYWQIKDMQSQGLFLARTVDGSGEWAFNPIEQQSEKIRQLATDHNKLNKSGKAATSTGEGVV